MPRARRRAYHHGDLRRTLVEHALAALERGGPDALSLRGLARAAGVSQAAPYNHFADKAALLGAVAAEGFRALRTEMATAAAGAAGRAKLDAIGVTYVGFARAHPALFRLMFGSAARARDGEAGEAGRAAFALLEETLRLDKARPPNPLDAVAAWALVHGLATLLIDGRLGGEAAPPAAAVIARVRIGG